MRPLTQPLCVKKDCDMEVQSNNNDPLIKTRVKNLYFIVVFLGLIAYALEYLLNSSAIVGWGRILFFVFVAWYFYRLLSTPCPLCKKSFFSFSSFFSGAIFNKFKCNHCNHEI